MYDKKKRKIHAVKIIIIVSHQLSFNFKYLYTYHCTLKYNQQYDIYNSMYHIYITNNMI